ncbi:biotin synthase auxiliary protein BsaP [Nocardioides agariphilus]|uniref:biotin synthase auxiliary protein BsaP n=1 Tax=Nocardioides agariphilus TaxID=433664 RepID=UPI003F980B41
MPAYCGRCGEPVDGSSAEGPHEDCARLLQLEPPRYCASCARRMKVQVSPMGWSATCVEHGTVGARARDQGSTTAP